MTARRLNNLADRLGVVKAAQADLAQEADRIKAELVTSGRVTIEGKLYRVTISHAERTNIGWQTIAERLGPSAQLVAAHTSKSTGPVVRVSARTQDAA
jgi:hypothetical protein